MKLFNPVILSLAASVLADQYVIQLQNSSVFPTFLQDSEVSVSTLKSNLLHNITIGNFQAIVADIDHDAVKSLQSHSLVFDIIPNIKVKAFEAFEVETQEDAPRHLARLSSASKLSENPPYDYYYGATGKGVYAYVVDSGIAIEHPEFEGRAIRGANFVTSEPDGDLNGHGTHVAGILGSKTYGVAKNVNIVEVKVLNRDGMGNLSEVLQGLEFAANDRASRKVSGVANLSIGSFYSGIVNDAVNAAYDTGLSIVVAAGNGALPAAWFSPASAEDAIAIGALDDKTDAIAFFSNYGQIISVFASGVDVESLNFANFNSSIALSGTSMSSPIVAGLAATLLEKRVPFDEIRSAITSLAKSGITLNVFDLKAAFSPDRIAYNGYGEKGTKSPSKTVDTPASSGPVSGEPAIIPASPAIVGANFTNALKPTGAFDTALLINSAQKRGVNLVL